MRTAWTPHAQLASPLKGEAVVSGRTGGNSFEVGSVTINQFPARMLNAAMQPSVAKREASYMKAAYIVAWRRCFAPT